MNLFKPRQIVVDLFTYDSAAYSYAKPALASKFYPEWWKSLPKAVYEDSFPTPTMKTCAGFIDLYKRGFMFPMWCDLFVKVEEGGSYVWKYADGVSTAGHHAPEAAGNLFVDNNVRNLKLDNPWLVSTKEDVYWVLQQPMWSQNLQRELIVPPAVVNFKHQNTTAINTLVADFNRPREFVVPFGLPLVHYIPTDSRPIKLNWHLVSRQEFEHIGMKNLPRSFFNAYRTKLGAKE